MKLKIFGFELELEFKFNLLKNKKEPYVDSKIYILSNNYQKARNLMVRYRFNAHYLESIESILGRHSNIIILLYGNCYERKDYDQVMGYVRSHNILYVIL